MARTNNLSNFLTDVASAIKTKKGSETNIPAANFDTEILALPSQGVYEQRVLNISANGSQTITPSAGFDAIDELALTVAVPEKQLQSKTYNFTQNTNIELLPDTGYDGFDSVTLNINVPGSTINNQDKTITQNGSYTADQGYTGIGTATVNVPITGTSEYNSDLLLSQQVLGGNALPYTKLEYIESTGTQYIDTNYYLRFDTIKVDTKIYIESMESSILHEGDIISNQDENTSRFVVGLYNSKVFGYSRSRTATDSNVYSTTYIGANLLSIIAEYDYTNRRKMLTVNGVTTTESQNATIANSNSSIRLLNNPTGEYGSFIGKLYYLKLYVYDSNIDDNVLVYDFIPVKRKSDNEICLYDKVTNTFFTNQGTGTFIAGPEIN